jgi:D-3-phosphoglycerate dehydrogenase / 2-oxoglutarate reductase
MELKSLFIDCNDQLAPVWQRVVRAEDPPIDVNRAAFAPTELSRLLNGYDICIDDHSYLPTALVERCDWLKHIVFLGTGAASYRRRRAGAARDSRPHHQGLRRYRRGRACDRADADLLPRHRADGSRGPFRHLVDARGRAALWQDPRRHRASIGREVLRIGGLGMRVIAWNRTTRSGEASVALDELLMAPT